MNDEQAIRDLVKTWMEATARGDLAKVLTLMDEDVVFFVPGQPPMRGKKAFASGFQDATAQFRIEGRSDIQEIKVNGDWAYCWNHLSVTMTPVQSGATMHREGYTLSILRKGTDGAWVMHRDANLLGPPGSDPS